jgi:hypothetical protein
MQFKLIKLQLKYILFFGKFVFDVPFLIAIKCI